MTPRSDRSYTPDMAIPDDHRRVGVDLPSAVVDRLDRLRAADGISRSTRLRLLLTLTEGDEHLMDRVREAAQREQQEKRDAAASGSCPGTAGGTWYSTARVAQRITEVLGEDVDEAAIHMAVHRTAARPNAAMRATAGLPPPLNPGKGSALRFSAEAVEEWLRDHPRIARAKLLEALSAEIGATEQRRAAAVAEGRAQGLSWAELAALIGQVDGVSVSRQSVAEKYGRRRAT